MDPWLESCWNGVHHTIISSLRRQACSQLPEGLYAEIDENVYMIDREPIIRTFQSEPITEGRIEIRDVRDHNALVTVIEVLSPTNKLDLRGRATYAAKRSAYVAANVNIVELDLLRAGDHLIGVPAEYIKPISSAPYICSVRRADSSPEQTKVDYFPIALRERLPRIRIPLRPTDAEAIVDLQEPINVAYQEGGFGIRIDYSKPPTPPLSPDDAAWAAGLVGIDA
jgi:hypothetical protein